MTTLTKTELDTPCREWQGGTTSYGCGQKRVAGKLLYVHRWVVAQILGWEAIEGKVVMHRCDNPPCFRYDHLLVGTYAENSADREAKGRGVRGTETRHAKLNDAKVATIRSLRAAGESRKAIASRFDVSLSAIDRILARTSWKHVV